MATKVPIPVENIAFERLNLSRHYLTVDCDFTCFIVLNPSGSVPSEGTDICAFHVGAWQVNAWTLLTKKDFPNQAGFSACLVWDKTLVSESARAPQCVESDIDVSNSISTLKGQPVNITGFSMPSGSSLPVRVVMGKEDIPVSKINPLPVRNSPFVLNIRVGTWIDASQIMLLENVSSQKVDAGPNWLYIVFPKRAICQYRVSGMSNYYEIYISGDYFAYQHTENLTISTKKFDLVRPCTLLYTVGKEDPLVSAVYIQGLMGTPRYSATGALEGPIGDNDNLYSVGLIEV